MILWIASILFKTKDLKHLIFSDPMEFYGFSPDRFRNFGIPTNPFHHRDPFDRLLIVQAIVEEMKLLSRDSRLSDYGIELIW